MASVIINTHRELFFKEMGSQLLAFSSQYQALLVDKVWMDASKKTEPLHYFYTVSKKTTDVLETASYLVNNFHSKPNLHSSLFILFRSILADLITTEYVIRSSSNQESEMLPYIQEVYFDHLDAASAMLLKTAPTVFGWDSDQAKKEHNLFISEVRKEYPEWEQRRKSSGIRSIVRKMAASPQIKAEKGFLKESYWLYERFSKLEHFGALSYNMLHRSYSPSQLQTIEQEVINSIGITVSGLMSYVKYLIGITNEDATKLHCIAKRIVMACKAFISAQGKATG